MEGFKKDKLDFVVNGTCRLSWK